MVSQHAIAGSSLSVKPMPRITIRAYSIIVLVLILAHSAPAFADWTNEAQAAMDLAAGYHALVLSEDGRWLVYVDGDGAVHRRNTGGTGQDQVFRLKFPPGALSISRNAKQIAFEDQRGCIGVLRSEGGTTGLQNTWIARNSGLPSVDARGSAQCESDDLHPPGAHWLLFNTDVSGAGAVALSPDGRLLAIDTSPVKIIDLTSGREIYTVPTEFLIRHLQFVDDGRKLLLVEAKLGAHEEVASDGSEMLFLTWDLKRKEPYNFYHTATTDELSQEGFLWSYSERTGDLWAINDNGNPWRTDPTSGKRVLAKIKPYPVNLKRCGAPAVARIGLDGNGDLFELAVDPQGRWIAVVQREYVSNHDAYSLDVYRTVDGSLLKRFALDSAVRSLAPTADGTAIYGTTSGKPIEEPNRLEPTFKGGGHVVRFDLAPVLLGMKSSPAIAWADAECAGAAAARGEINGGSSSR